MNDIPQVNSLFQQPWWLDAVAPERWSEIIIEQGGVIEARLPLVQTRRWPGVRGYGMPTLTQTLGPWIATGESESYAIRLSREHQLMGELIDRLPPRSLLSHRFHHTVTNWLPFYWRNYQQRTRYTYIIPDISDPERVHTDFRHSKRKNIKKAKEAVAVDHELSAAEFYANHMKTLAKEGKRIGYGEDLFRRIHDATLSKGAGKIFAARDAAGNLHSALFVVWDERSAYYLISTIDPEFRNSGSVTLLIWEAIQFLSSRTRMFDFEGSMIQPIERAFRDFGAVQTPYLEVQSTSVALCSMARRRWHARQS